MALLALRVVGCESVCFDLISDVYCAPPSKRVLPFNLVWLKNLNCSSMSPVAGPSGYQPVNVSQSMLL